MLKVQVIVKRSPVHGLGIFAVEDIKAGQEVFRFSHWKKDDPLGKSRDFKIPLATADDEEKHFGYVCPRTPEMLSICGDHARYWNFANPGDQPNCVSLQFDSHGEDIIVAARDIAEGDELLLDMATDLDAPRKLNLAPVATN